LKLGTVDERHEMTLEAQIESRLVSALDPERMQLVNESHQHSGPGAETHFNLIIVAEAFAGKNLVGRHRVIYAALGDELKNGLHALTMKTLTPKEWEDAGGDVKNPAPKCRGGSKN